MTILVASASLEFLDLFYLFVCVCVCVYLYGYTGS